LRWLVSCASRASCGGRCSMRSASNSSSRKIPRCAPRRPRCGDGSPNERGQFVRGHLFAHLATFVYMVAMMVSVGIGLRTEQQNEQLPKKKKRRRQLGLHLRALLLNVVLVPGLAVLLTRSLHLAGDVAFAVLVIGASPGGRFAPHLARIASADVGLATEQTVLLAKLTLFTAPLTL